MKSSTSLIIAGVLALIAGVAALVFPLPASLAVTALVGWAFILSGIVGLWAAISDSALTQRGWLGFVSLLNLVLGIWMLADPLTGMISLTLMVGALLCASGATRIYVGLTTLRGTQTMWLVVLSGIISLLLGLYILFGLPATGIVTLGILAAVELIVVGATILSTGITLRRETSY